MFYAILIAAVIRAGGAQIVKDWKDGAEMVRLNSNITILQASNEKCGTDVASVRHSLSALARAIEDRA